MEPFQRSGEQKMTMCKDLKTALEDGLFHSYSILKEATCAVGKVRHCNAHVTFLSTPAAVGPWSAAVRVVRSFCLDLRKAPSAEWLWWWLSSLSTQWLGADLPRGLEKRLVRWTQSPFRRVSRSWCHPFPNCLPSGCCNKSQVWQPANCMSPVTTEHKYVVPAQFYRNRKKEFPSTLRT